MIYFRDKDRIIKSIIVSKNDEKLKEFALCNGKLEFKNLELISSEYRRVGASAGWFDGGYLQSAKEINGFGSNAINRFRFKKLTTLRIVAEALKNSDVNVKDYSPIVSWSYGVQLENFFETVDYYWLEDSLSFERLRESKIFGGVSAINNRKILTKTKEIITRIDK